MIYALTLHTLYRLLSYIIKIIRFHPPHTLQRHNTTVHFMNAHIHPSTLIKYCTHHCYSWIHLHHHYTTHCHHMLHCSNTTQHSTTLRSLILPLSYRHSMTLWLYEYIHPVINWQLCCRYVYEFSMLVSSGGWVPHKRLDDWTTKSRTFLSLRLGVYEFMNLTANCTHKLLNH
jgi:hypothetical protein